MTTQAILAPAADVAYHEWTAILGYVDTWTSDGRRLAGDGMTVRPLPLTLAFMPATDDGHTGSYPIGTIEKVWTDGSKLMGSGKFDSAPTAQEAARLIDEQVQREISIDPTVQEYVATYPLDYQEEVVIDEAGNEAVQTTENVKDYGVTFTAWELAGATVVTGGAFTGTEITVTADGRPSLSGRGQYGGHIETGAELAVTAAVGDAVGMVALYPTVDEAAALAATGTEAADAIHLTLTVFNEQPDEAVLTALLTDFAAAQPALAGDVTGVAVFAPGPDGTPVVALADVLGLAELQTALCDVLEAAGIAYAEDHDFVPHLTLAYDPDPAASVSADHAAISLPLTFAAVSYSPVDGTRSDYPLTGTEDTSEVAEGEGAGVTAAAAGIAPLHPPADWFRYPEFTGPTPITVTPEGHIYGHFAPFDVCHTGRQGSCLNSRQLTSRAGYAYFKTGYVLTAEGIEVPTGPLVMGTDHPDVRSGVREAQAHYCNTGLVVADVTVGDDAWGQWMSGAIRPDVPAEKVRALRGSAPSGDWKPINGAAELIGILAVNTPGFPQVRIAASADEELLAAVAVGSYTPGELDSYLAPPSDDKAMIKLRVLQARVGGLDGLRELLPK